MFGSPLFWRETHRQPRFLMLDGRIVVLILLTVMHIRVWTIALTLLAILVLWWFDRKGVSADSILRFLRSTLVGRRRTARGPAAERAVVDYGFETEAHVARIRRVIASRSAAAERTLSKSAARRSGRSA
jgi:hypothetical protein